MDRCRRSNTNCVYLAEKRLVIGIVGGTIIIGDFFTLIRISVDDADKVHVRHVVVFFSVEFSHYEEVPGNLAEKIIQQAKQEKEEAS